MRRREQACEVICERSALPDRISDRADGVAHIPFRRYMVMHVQMSACSAVHCVQIIGMLPSAAAGTLTVLPIEMKT